MLRKDLLSFELYLADAVRLPAERFLALHAWPILILPSPDWARIRRVWRRETIAPALPLSERIAAPEARADDDRLILPVRPRDPGDPERITLGRGAEADVVLLDETVSKVHAEIAWDAQRERCVLTDLGSRNGTYVSGVRLAARSHVELVPGMVLAFGSLPARYATPRSFLTWLLTENPTLD